MDTTWLRWCDESGAIIPTGEEKSKLDAERAEREAQRAERLAAKLREMGIDPE
jgi:hypothetical protein